MLLVPAWACTGETGETDRTSQDDLSDNELFINELPDNKLSSDELSVDELLVHRITNERLKAELIEFDRTFSDYPSAQGRDLYISIYDICQDSMTYWIGYMSGINITVPIVVCEPVNGKNVYLLLEGLGNDFNLDLRKRLEVLKNATPDEYLTHKRAMETPTIIDGNREYGPVIIDVIFDFVGLRLVFDHNQNLIRKDTAGFY